MRGDHKGFEGKVSRVDRRKYRIFVEGVTREKVDGSSVPVPLHPSKVMLTDLNLDDRWRRESLKAEIPVEEEEKPQEKPAERRKRKKAEPEGRKEKRGTSRKRTRRTKTMEESKGG